LPLLHVGTTGLPLLGGAALGQAKRSEEIDGTAANQWQPAQVAIKPGGTVTFRIAGGQTSPVGSGQAPPGDRRFDASKCQPRTSPRSGTLAR
jgi:plastocyanin